MTLPFPLKDVQIEFSDIKKEVKTPLYQDGFFTLNQNEFSMDVRGVAWFYVSGGNYISILPYPGADANTISLYLNGSAYGAILHQRKIMPLHGSCFRYKRKGVMICGETGAGKSSLTASFCLDGAEFLTDDVTPVRFKKQEPYVWALSDRIKLWSDTLSQLEIDGSGLHRVHPDADKYYHRMDPGSGSFFRLKQIYIMQVEEVSKVTFEELTGTSKFQALRNEVYRPEYLNGMPENEAVYFGNLLLICNNVRTIRTIRPRNMQIQDLMKIMEKQISSNSKKR